MSPNSQDTSNRQGPTAGLQNGTNSRFNPSSMIPYRFMETNNNPLTSTVPMITMGTNPIGGASVPIVITPTNSTEQTPSPQNALIATMNAAVVANTSNNNARPSDSPVRRRVPPMILQRQQSEVSAWMSEVDSQYHSDSDEETLEEVKDEMNSPRRTQHQTPPLPPRSTQRSHRAEEEETTISRLSGSYFDDMASLKSRKSLALSEIDSQVLSRTSRDSRSFYNKSTSEEAKEQQILQSQGFAASGLYLPGSLMALGPEHQARGVSAIQGGLYIRTVPSEDASTPRVGNHQSTPDEIFTRSLANTGAAATAAAVGDHLVTLGSMPIPSYDEDEIDNRQNRPTHAFIPHVRQEQTSGQAGGDDTSEARSSSCSPRKTFNVSEAHSTQQSSAVIGIWQRRCAQTEERALSLAHRLTSTERLHRQVADELREAHWETSNLQEQVREQQMRIMELERQKRITNEWSSETEDEVVMQKTAMVSPDFSGSQQDVEQQVHLARLATEQEHSRRQVKELIRDLKRSQDKLLKAEKAKKDLLLELEKSEQVQEHLASVAKEENDRKKKEVERNLLATQKVLESRLSQSDDELLQLRAIKLAVESSLHESLKREEDLKNALGKAQIEIKELAGAHCKAQEENAALAKQVRFADEQLEAFTNRQAELQTRYAELELQSQQTAEAHAVEVKILKASKSHLMAEKQDLHDSLQKAVLDQKSAQAETESVRLAVRETEVKVEELEGELNASKAAKLEAEASLKGELAAQKKTIERERAKTKEDHCRLQEDLDFTRQQVDDLRKVLKDSHEKRQQLDIEQETLRKNENSLRTQLLETETKLNELDAERVSLKQTLDILEEEKGTFAHQLATAQVTNTALQQQFREAEAAAAELQAKTLGEHKALQLKLEASQSRSLALEKEAEELNQKVVLVTKEKEDFVSQIQSLQDEILVQKDIMKKEMDEKVGAMHRDFEMLETTVKTLESEQEALQNQKSVTEAKLSELEIKLKNETAQHEQLQNQMGGFRQRVEGLEQSLALKESEVKDLEVSRDSLEEQHYVLQEEYKAIALKVEDLEVSHTDARNMVIGLEERRSELEAKVDSLEEAKGQLQEKYAESQKEARETERALSEELEDVENTLAGAAEQSNLLMLSLRDSEQAQQSLKLLHEETISATKAKYEQELQEVREMSSAALNALQKEQETVHTSLCKTKESRDELEIKFAEAENKLAETLRLLAASEEEKSELKEELSIASDRFNAIDTKLAESRAECQQLRDEKETLAARAHKVEADLASTVSLLRESQDDRDSLNGKLASIMAENVHVVGQLSAAQSMSDVLNIQLAEVNERHEALRIETEQLRLLTEQERNKHESEVQKLQNEASSLEAEKHEVENCLNAAQESIKSLELGLAKAKEEASTTSASLEEYERNRIALDGEIGALKAEMALLVSSKKHLFEEKESLSNKYDASVQELSEKISAAELKRNSLEGEIQSMTTLMDAARKEKKDISKQLETALVTLTSTEEKLASSQAQMVEVSHQRDSACSKHMVVEEKYTSVCKEMELLKEKFDNLQSDKDQVTANRADILLDLNEAMREVKDLEGEKEKMLLHHMQVEVENEELISKLSSAEEKATSLENELGELRDENGSLVEKTTSLVKDKDELVEQMEKDTLFLRESLEVVENDKASIRMELAASQSTIGELDSVIAGLEHMVQESSQKQKSTDEKLGVLTEEKRALATCISNLEADLAVINEKHDVAKSDVEETRRELNDAKRCNVALQVEKEQAMVLKAELEAKVDDQASKISSYESLTSRLQTDIHSMAMEINGLKKERAQSRSVKVDEVLCSVGDPRSGEENDSSKANVQEQDFSQALGPIHKKGGVPSQVESIDQVSNLKVENQSLVERLAEAEAAISALKKEMKSKDFTTGEILKKLGKQIGKDSAVISSLGRKVDESKKENRVLKRATKYLVKRTRTLEAELNISNVSIDLPFSIGCTPESKGDLAFKTPHKEALQPLATIQDAPIDSPMESPIEGSPDTCATSIIRVYREEIVLEMHYHDIDGKLQSYEVTAQYTGPLLDGKPMGAGMLRFDNGDMYLGEFENGEMNGVGAFAHKQRSRHANQVFSGQFSHNEFTGDYNAVPNLERVCAASVASSSANASTTFYSVNESLGSRSTLFY